MKNEGVVQIKGGKDEKWKMKEENLKKMEGGKMGDILENCNEYIEYLKTKNYKQSTIGNKTLYLKQFQAFCREFAIEGIEEITAKHLIELSSFLRKLRDEHKTKKSDTENNSYIRDKMLNISQFFYYLQKQNKIVVNPFDKCILPNRAFRLPKNILSEEKMFELIKATETLNNPTSLRDKAMIELVYSSALRRSEVVHLSIQDIDFANHQVFIKSGKSRRDRILPIGESAETAIKTYLEKCRALWLTTSKEQHLFLTINGKALKVHSMTEILSKYTTKLGMPKIGWHTIRHTCATHLLQNGADIRYIQELLGHSNLHTTEIYTKVTNSDLQKKVQNALSKKKSNAAL